MADVLLVSKPVVPPWNDSSKNLVRDLAQNLSAHRARIMVRQGDADGPGDALPEPVYLAGDAGFAPGRSQNLRVLKRLMLGRGGQLWHFFFAPNPRTSMAARWSSRLRRMPTVQTVCSAPAPGADLQTVLFADRVVVLSAHTQRRFEAEGVAAARLRRIPPCIPLLTPPSAEARQAARDHFELPREAPLLLYAGDLEVSRGADLALESFEDLPTDLGAVLVMACRAKTDAARDRERELRERIEAMGLQQRVHWLGETSEIHRLLGAVDLLSLVADNLFAKMDLPLVAVEAMALGTAVLVAQGTAAEELAEAGACVAVCPEREAVSLATRELLQDPSRRAEQAARGAEAASSRYSPSAMARAYEALYDELL